MVYFLLFVFFLMISILLTFIKHEHLSFKNKIIIFILSVIVILSIMIYQFNFDKKSEKNRQILNHFNQGQTLACKEYFVNSESFSFFGGTSSFVAKESNQTLKGVIVKLEDCEIK